MPETNTSSWSNFAVGKPGNNYSQTCKPLETIYHVSHIESALSIIKQGKLKAGLIYDDSYLNSRRILVTWFSPNDWYYGSIYGNIRFQFDWKKLIEDRHYYWIGTMEGYHPTAIRILLSKNDYKSKLKPYNPIRGDGPWWHNKANDKHFWNGNYTLEIMLEDDVSLRDALKVDFIDHHKDICTIKPNCPDHYPDRNDAAALFLAGSISQHPPTIEIPQIEGISSAISNLCLSIIRKSPSGRLLASSQESTAIIRAFMAASYFGRKEESKVFWNMFKSNNEFLNACKRLIETLPGLSPDELDGLFP